MKNVLILSCSTGQGHNSCAQAVKEYFGIQGVKCEILDALTFVGKKFARFMAWGHSFMYRYLPGLFRWGYRYSQNHPGILKEGSVIYRILTTGAKQMREYLIREQIDTVICTHSFAAMILTHMQKKEPLPLRTAFIVTDYTCYPGMEAIDVQRYFIPSDCLMEEFSRYGIPRERMIAAGIPVCQSFHKCIEKEDAKRLLNIHVDNKHLLMMCGSMGCGPMEKLLKHIAAHLPKQTEVSVICGTNQLLQRKLKRIYRKLENIHIIGYTNQMSLYMDSADICLTKPGGISVTEAALKHLPMAFVNAVAGCEQYNTEFFVNMGAAVTDHTLRGLAQKSLYLLNATDKRKQMECVLERYCRNNGAEMVFMEMSGGKDDATRYYRLPEISVEQIKYARI